MEPIPVKVLPMVSYSALIVQIAHTWTRRQSLLEREYMKSSEGTLPDTNIVVATVNETRAGICGK